MFSVLVALRNAALLDTRVLLDIKRPVPSPSPQFQVDNTCAGQGPRSCASACVLQSHEDPLCLCSSEDKEM